MSSPAYEIREWSKRFENAESRKRRGAMDRILVPTKHDGKGMKRLMLRADAARLYGAWVILLQLAAKCPTRGVLADDDGPLSLQDIHLKTGLPEDDLQHALHTLSTEPFCWMTPPAETSRPVPDSPEHAAPAPTGGLTDDVMSLLQRLSVPESLHGKLAPTASVSDVLHGWLRIDRSTAGAGMQFVRLVNDASSRVHAPLVFSDLVAAADAGVVKWIAGVDVADAELTYDTLGLMADGELIAGVDEIETAELG